MADTDVWYKIEHPKGIYNSEYIPHLQVFGRPESPLPLADVPVLFADTPRLTKAFARVTGRDWDLKMTAPGVNTINAIKDRLWNARRMGGFEYENGRLESALAVFPATRAYAATEVDLDVNTKVVPHVDWGKARPDPIQDTIKRITGDAIPDEVRTKVYVVAPKNLMPVVMQMIATFAAEREETPSHRGLSFNFNAAMQTLPVDARAKFKAAGYEEDIAWFDVKHGVFFTLDKDMFERVKKMFDAAPVTMRSPRLRAALTP
jgi:hypothetical protein